MFAEALRKQSDSDFSVADSSPVRRLGFLGWQGLAIGLSGMRGRALVFGGIGPQPTFGSSATDGRCQPIAVSLATTSKTSVSCSIFRAISRLTE